MHGEIIVEGRDSRLIVNLCTLNEARVSERDWPISILLQEPLDAGPMVLSVDGNGEHAACSQCNNFSRPRGVDLAHEEASLCNYGFARAKRRRAIGKKTARAVVIRVHAREERNKRAGVEKNTGAIHSPNPSRWRRLVERSRGPFVKRPTLRPASSSALRWRLCSDATSRIPRRTISDSLCPVAALSSSSVARSSGLRRA